MKDIIYIYKIVLNQTKNYIFNSISDFLKIIISFLLVIIIAGTLIAILCFYETIFNNTYCIE